MRSMKRNNLVSASRMSRRHVTTLAIALAGALGLTACEGDNLFTGGGPSLGQGPPVVTSIIAPASINEGATLDVRVKAIAPRGMTNIQIRFRRGINAENSNDITGSRRDTVTVDATQQVPSAAADSIIIVEAFATDATGAVSAVRSDTVRVIDSSAPTVSLQSSTTGASPGGSLQVRVNAEDRMGLKSVGYVVLSSPRDTVLRSQINTAGFTKDTTFTVRLPVNLSVDNLSIIGVAINNANLRGVSSPLVLELTDTVSPTVIIVEPVSGESYTRGVPLRVRVQLRDSTSGLAQLTIRGVAFRNFPDSLQNSAPIVRFPQITIPFPQGPDRPAPVDTIIVRDLLPNADTTTEPIYIIAVATDREGNSSVDTVQVIPGPRITILNPTTGAIARVGSTIPVRLQAVDPSAGIDSLKLYVGGVRTDTIVVRGLAGTRDPVELLREIPTGTQTGTLELRAEVWNALGTRGITPQPVRITISLSATSDTTAPRVRRLVESPERVELRDSIRITVRATDDAGTGIVRIGAVVIVIPANESAALPRDTFFFSTSTFSPAVTGTPEAIFNLQLSNTYRETGAIRFPQAFTLQVHGYAIDGASLCGASVQETFQSLACQSLGGGANIASGQTGQVYGRTGVAGTSVRLPTGSVIADALPDTINQRVYMSNFARNQLEVLSLRDTVLAAPVLVGSQPWGLFLVPGGGAVDTLMVANSGGTNISFVPTDLMREDAPRRLLTPNTALHEIVESTGNGFLRYTVKALEFSDRPQFVAQDRNKMILFSTKPTSAASEGTLRYAVADPTPANLTDIVRPETKIIFGREAVTSSNTTYAIARVDSILIAPSAMPAGDDGVIIFDHRDGFPDSVFNSGINYPGPAADTLRARGSDIYFDRGTWNRGVVGFGDTTYVAYSKDLSVLAFGEGAVAPFGRIILWDASPNPLLPEMGRTSAQGTLDLIGNAAERVLGVALNVDGSFGVGRGAVSTYFFSNNIKQEGPLRLQGIFDNNAIAGGNGGVALHPHHGTVAAGSTATTMAFIATGSRTIKIVDTFHYFELGEIPIRDNIVGQLRAVPPSATLNTSLGLTADQCDFTIAQLIGVTSANKVVIINVRNKDLIAVTRVTPCRP